VYGAARRTHHGWSYRFRVQGVGAGIEVTSAYLWLHKNRDVSVLSDDGDGGLTLDVRSVYDDDDDDNDVDDSARSRDRRYELSWVSGWEKMNVTGLVRRRGASRLTVRCVGSSADRCRETVTARSARRRPFVVVATAAARRPADGRSRRHLRRCVGGDCCALHQYFITFEELGWGFIQRPKGFNVNYCYGSCRGQPCVLDL